MVLCTATLFDAEGRPLRGALGSATWGILLDPRSGMAGGSARWIEPGQDVHADYPVTPGYPKGIAAYRDLNCQSIPPNQRPM